MNVLTLLRVRQWYKNLVIFLPIFFSGYLLSQPHLKATIIGFFALCSISSCNYIINDIIDRNTDKVSHKKAKNLITAKKITITIALILAILLFTIAYLLSTLLASEFIYFILALFLTTSLYSLFLKHETFVDVITLSINFVIRAVSGAFVITEATKPYVWVSPWLLLCVFFLALFLGAGKRYAEANALKAKNKTKFKKTLNNYTPEVTATFMTMATTMLVLAYSLYSFLSVTPELIYSLPFAIYTILRYYFFIYTKSKKSTIALTPENFYQDKRLLIGMLLWVATVGSILYFF